MTNVQTAWASAKVVRTREKVTFFIGVMAVLSSALLFGLAPEWIHVVYTVMILYLLPTRFYVYKKKLWCVSRCILVTKNFELTRRREYRHYFLFDLCYYANILCLMFLWIAPGSARLWVATYLLAHGQCSHPQLSIYIIWMQPTEISSQQDPWPVR